MFNLFDAYELRARIFPAVLMISPIVFPLIPLIKSMDLEIGETIYIVFVFLAIIYLFAMLVRFKGKNIEDELHEYWGGDPVVLFIMKNNDRIGTITKGIIREKVKRCFKISISPGEQTEEANILEAFRLIKSMFHDDTMLANKHNAEYGFLRNLSGCFNIWVFISLLSWGVSIGLVVSSFKTINIFATIVSTFYVIAIIVISKKGLYERTKKAAFTYAQTTWIAFYHYKIQDVV